MNITNNHEHKPIPEAQATHITNSAQMKRMEQIVLGHYYWKWSGALA